MTVGNGVRRLGGMLCLAFFLALTPGAWAQSAASDERAAVIAKGGLVLLMRHASAPRQLPTQDTASPGNDMLERQLDAEGRETAKAMGEALRTLGVDVAEVLTSPAFRARETAREAGWGEARIAEQLDSGKAREDGAADWLRETVAMEAAPGSARVIVTHMPNIMAAYGDHAADMGDGEALLFRADHAGGSEPLMRIPIGDWPGLAGQ